jgi:hypothetical protein
MISALPCRHVLIILDCCFAGTFRWAGRRDDRGGPSRVYRETLERFVHHRAWQVLVSASHDQTALDEASQRQGLATRMSDTVGALAGHRLETESHSPFAAALLRGLQGAADYTNDGLIVAAELELYVRDAVETSTRIQQTPQLYKLEEHDRGEFVFQVPGIALALEPAPALSLAVCPYQGLRPYGTAERDRYFGRGKAIAALVDRVKTRALTVVLGPSGAGKSSLIAAGLVPALRDAGGWTVIEARPGPGLDALHDAIVVPARAGRDPGSTLLERVTAWMSVHPSGWLCLAIDQAEALMMFTGAAAGGRVLDDLAHALEAHGLRFRLVLALRSEFEPVFRSSALAPLWAAGAFVVPALAHHELREIIERPARAVELSFDPPALVDTLINDVLEAPGGLPLLSFALRELYARCVARNRDRLLSEGDYADMGRLSGALAQRASQLLGELVESDAAYEATARRVFLRMVVGRDDEWVRRRVHRDELVYADDAENQRVANLLATFRDARLIVHDKNEWEPSHDWLVRGWPTLSMWRVRFGARAFALQFDLAEAAGRWHRDNRPAQLWTDDVRLPDALEARRAPGSWLNARERGFVAASARRRRLRIGAAATILGLVALGALVVWDLHERVHVDYFRHYVWRWGELEGVDALTDREVHGRAVSVKVLRKGHLGHVVHVELVRGGEQLACQSIAGFGWRPELEISDNAAGERVARQSDFTYDSTTDAVAIETGKDCAGRLVYKAQYLGGVKERAKAVFLDERGNDAQVKRGNAERVEIIRSPQGFDVEKRYTLRHGEPAYNQEGILVEKLDYDERGRLIGRSYFDPAGNPMRQKDGDAGWRSRLGERGDEIERAYFDEAGRPTRTKDGIAGWRSKFDERGNATEVGYFDEAGKPTWNNDGVAGWRSKFDERGNATELGYVDKAGRPTRTKDGIAGWRSTFDERGNATEVGYFDQVGNPTRNKDGIAGWRAKFDERGKRTEVAYLDEAGKPTRNKVGVAGRRSRFDERGNETEAAYLGEAGKPTRNRDGIAGWRSQFDDRGNETEVAYFDEVGKPTRNKQGIAGWRSTFDERSLETEVAYFDEVRKPTRNRDGVAGRRSKFDQRGNMTEQAFFDEVGEPTRHKDGYAAWWSKFDERGNATEIGYVDEAGKPTGDKDGIAGWRSKLDERGNEVERAFFDEAGEPMLHKDGYAGWRLKLDGRGNVTDGEYFDEAGKPTQDSNGVGCFRSKLDERGNEVERAFFDEAGEPTRDKNGVASLRSKFDERGNEVERAFFDEAGKPVRHKRGFAGGRSKFDERGNETERTFFDETGKPTRQSNGIVGWRSKFDERGNVTEVAYFDEVGKPMRHKDGYAVVRSKLDEHDNETEQAYFDEAGKPTRHRDGYAVLRAKFDERGNAIEVAYLDEVGKPTRDSNRIAGWRSKFDARGHEIERAFFGETGKPTRHKDGIAGWRSKFDARGNETERAFFGETGKPTRDSNRIAGRRSKFDARGHETEVSFFDETGKPARYKNRTAVIRARFDTRGNLIETLIFSEDGPRASPYRVTAR